MHWHNAYAFWGILAVDTKQKRQLKWILTDASVHIQHKKQFLSAPPPSGGKTIYPPNIALHSTLTKIWCQFTATKNCKQNLSWYTYNLTYKQTRWTKRQNLFTLLLLIKQKYNRYSIRWLIQEIPRLVHVLFPRATFGNHGLISTGRLSLLFRV